MSQNVVLTLPDELYKPIERNAQATNQPVESLLLTALQASLPSLEGLPADLARELVELETLGDESLREENLWLACHRCNAFKGTQTRAPDPQTGSAVALFNPRQQTWTEHFAWSEDGTEILGKTPWGRATVAALKMNNPEIVVSRRLWVSAGGRYRGRFISFANKFRRRNLFVTSCT